MQTINTDPALGVTVKDNTAYYSLGSNLWRQLTVGWFAKETWHYSPPGPPPAWKDGEFATMNMRDWDKNHNWSSAKMRLEKALGFGTYEQSLRVGKGTGLVTTFYLSEYDRDQHQEIDFEFSGNCNPPSDPDHDKFCGTAMVQTNVWDPRGTNKQFPYYNKLWSGKELPPKPLPDTTEGWGFDVYRYKIDWQPKTVQWSVDRTGKGTNYTFLREHDVSSFGYKEELMYPFFSFWPGLGWSPDGSKFDPNQPDKLYQAFFFQALRFTPSASNKITRIGS
jgi:beta-glucanase (GH16 family)